MNSQAPLRVVLVDDHENDRYLVARELARQFPAVQVIEVVDETGLAHVLAAGAFDLLITDYVLHWSDGLRVLREVKARYSHCPVIMFTNSGNENVAVEAMKAGLDDYVLKSSKHFVRLALAARSALDRGQTRRRAAELEGRLQALVGRLNVGVYRATLDGRLVECNPALSHLLGLPSPDAAHTVNLNELFLKLEERAAMVEQLRRDGQLPRRDVAMRRPDDTVIWTQMSETLVPAESGYVIDGLIVDITQAKRAEEALRESEERFRFLVESIPHMVWAARPDGNFDYFNARIRAYLGVSPEQVQGRAWAETIHPDDRQRALEAWELAFRNGTEFRIEYRVRNGRTGEYRWFIGHALPLKEAGGRVVRWFGTCTDIDERKRAEEELRESAERLQALSRRVVEVQEEERRRIARELHDEIGQVLGAISVNLHAVRGVCDTGAWPRVDECLGIVDGAIQQVRNLALDLRPSMLDDLGLATALRWLVDRQAQRAALIAHFVVHSSGAPLASELGTSCFRVAQEALTNVVRHARARHVWIELQQGEDEVQLVIQDDGVGFNPDEARRRAAWGQSLGLLGIQERIELLGGQSAIESEPGHGTTIRVRVPVASAPPSEDPGDGGERP